MYTCVKVLNKTVVYLYMKMRAKYVNVSITEELAVLIDEAIKKSKLGYRSRAEFLSEAAREKIEKLKKN